jgi:hypothetical protein
MTPGAAPVGPSRLLRYSTRRGRGQLGPVNLARWSLARLSHGPAPGDDITTSEVRVWTKVVMRRELSTEPVGKPVDYHDF